MNKFTFYIILASLIFASIFLVNKFHKPVPVSTPQISSSTVDKPPTEVIAQNLEVPWALAFLSSNDLLITERKGTVNLLKTDGKILEIGKINEVKQITESGLHGVAVDPDFSTNQYVYFYYTYGEALGNTQNRVSRFKFDGQSLTEESVIIDNIPGAPIHDGGRLKFGPDKLLYVTTGDAANPSLAQEKNSLAGKILRYRDGKTEVFSYGHRNPQGITWDSSGKLWETEHGQSATDEINLVEQDKNYGWPTIRGDQTNPGMETPALQSGSDTWAPAGAAFYNGSIYFGGLRGQSLYQYDTENKRFKTHFHKQFGRIRDVILGPDNMLYITTSNRDGRGSPSPDDDKIIRINPQKLE